MRLDATYLCWVDFSGTGLTSQGYAENQEEAKWLQTVDIWNWRRQLFTIQCCMQALSLFWKPFNGCKLFFLTCNKEFVKQRPTKEVWPKGTIIMTWLYYLFYKKHSPVLRFSLFSFISSLGMLWMPIRYLEGIGVLRHLYWFFFNCYLLWP